MAEVQHDNSAEHVVSEKKDLSASDDVPDSFGTMTKDDKRAFILLVVLYALQGIPVGLTFGTMPFLLKSHVGYGGLGFFMLSTYPTRSSYCGVLLSTAILSVHGVFLARSGSCIWAGEKAGSYLCR